MKFDSLQFVGFCLIAVALLRAAPAGGRFRDIALVGLNSFFLFSFVSEPLQLLPLLLFVIGGYGIILLAPRVGEGVGIALLMLMVVVAFIWLKRYSVIAFLPFIKISYLTVGLSYILFRILHLVIDVAQGAVRVPKPLVYLNYTFFFLTFVSGPIQRFQDFSAQIAVPQYTNDALQINSALERIIRGYFMIAVVCSFTAFLNEKLSHHFYSKFAVGLEVNAVIFYAGVAFTQLLHLYTNFSGYMHICIGIGRLLGFTLPENFDRPYKAKNFLDFWSRWHITLSEWFKFYLFNPILKALVSKWGATQSAPYFGAVAFFATFLVMGIWHGTTIVFVFYGLLLASGVTLNKLWQIMASKWFGKIGYKKICHKPWYINLSRAVALAFFAVALTCIWIEPIHVAGMVSLRGLLCGVLAFFVLSLAFAVLGWIAAHIYAIIPQGILLVSDGGLAATAWIALKFFLLINIMMLIDNGAPEFVYRAF